MIVVASMSSIIFEEQMYLFTAGLGLATIYLTATFSFNVYRGLSWHNAQSKLEIEESEEQPE
jgi:hypothetical protein